MFDKSNYRPVSILPVVSLIFERHVNLHFKTFLEANDLLYSRQSGSRENHSCQTSLIRIIDDWITAMINMSNVTTHIRAHRSQLYLNTNILV